jgi:phosphomannomutase
MTESGKTLREKLDYTAVELRFGTSGRRGRVRDLTQLEIYINAEAELTYLASLRPEQGGITYGGKLYIAHDLRPSSTRFAPEEGGRGEICQAIKEAARSAQGLETVNLGPIPTPALMYYATRRGCASVMVTGSHIPFDLNGYKLNTSAGELLKEHEDPIGRAVAEVRERAYSTPFAKAQFNERGMFRDGHRELPPVDDAGRKEWITRYVDFFGETALGGMRIAVYQHSAVGRDILARILSQLGADVVPCGRSEEFVAIDTEAIDDDRLAAMQKLADEAGKVDALVSTDGDSDRPLILAPDAQGKLHFFGGDLVGMVVAQYLGADAVVVPISCNDGIDIGPLAPVLEPKTRIGSPHVIAGIERAARKGRRAICGWEANGGFLLGSDIRRGDHVLSALPTRDAMLPILAVLCAAKERGLPVLSLFEALPRRFSRAALLRPFPREQGQRIVAALCAGGAQPALDRIFEAARGFGEIARIDCTDGARLIFANREVAHFRPSGNADEFRVYAVADSQARADEIVRIGVAEPDGSIRRLEREFAG